MEKNKFNKIINTLKIENLSDEEKEKIYACLGIKKVKVEENQKVSAVESFIKLTMTNEELYEKYGEYIAEYYDMTREKREKVCEDAYKYFLNFGSFDINVICTILIPFVADSIDDVIPIQKIKKPEDPVISAIRENNRLFDERPEIDFSRINYDI